MDELKPLGLGELIDRSVTLFRTHWRALFAIALPLNLIQFVVFLTYEIVGRLAFPAIRNPQKLTALMKTDPGAVALQAAIGYPSLALVVFLTVALVSVGHLRQAHYLAPHTLGGAPISLGASWLATRSQLGTMLGVLLLSLGWGALFCLLASVVPAGMLVGSAFLASAGSRVLGVGLGVAGAVLWGLALLVVGLWYLVRFFTSSAVVALDGLGVWKSFQRCRDFARGRVEPGAVGLVALRVTVLITIAWTAVTVVTLTGGAPSFVLKVVYGNLLSPSETNLDAVPLWAQVPADLLQYVVLAAVTPLLGVVQLLHYVDLRVRREGLDLLQRLAPKAP